MQQLGDAERNREGAEHELAETRREIDLFERKIQTDSEVTRTSAGCLAMDSQARDRIRDELCRLREREREQRAAHRETEDELSRARDALAKAQRAFETVNGKAD